MLKTKIVLALVVAMSALGACATDDGGEAKPGATATAPAPATVTEAAAPTVTSGDPILIETRVTNARGHTSDVLDSSLIGEKAFCRGGTTRGSSSGPVITTRFKCGDGTLEIQFAPTQVSWSQGAPWTIVGGTGSFKGLNGGGSMVAVFRDKDPDVGREIFTGLVSK
jgi:hypothetical protein